MSDRVLGIVVEAFPKLMTQMVKITIPLTVISFTCGMLLALILALVQVSNVPGLKQFARLYVWIFRGTPLLVQLFIIFFGLPSLGIYLDGFVAASIAFSLNLAAYNSEILRAAILSVPIGQTEAAYMVGLNYFQTMVRIILPQAFRTAFPPIFSSLIGLVKDTSLAATITVIDMMAIAKQVAARYYEPFAMYVETALIYLAICTILTFLQAHLEKKMEWKMPEQADEKKEEKAVEA